MPRDAEKQSTKAGFLPAVRYVWSSWTRVPWQAAIVVAICTNAVVALVDPFLPHPGDEPILRNLVFYGAFHLFVPLLLMCCLIRRCNVASLQRRALGNALLMTVAVIATRLVYQVILFQLTAVWAFLVMALTGTHSLEGPFHGPILSGWVVGLKLILYWGCAYVTIRHPRPVADGGAGPNVPESGAAEDISKRHVALLKALPLMLGICLLVAVWVLAAFHFSGTSSTTSYYTCENCGSVRVVETNETDRETVYLSPASGACSHTWERGSGTSVSPHVGDGMIVLLKKADAYGAFILKSQTEHPDTFEYEWYYRTDGGGTFRAEESGVYSTSISISKPIQFGPFSISGIPHAYTSSEYKDGRWTTTARAQLEYPRFPGEAVGAEDTRICVTSETDVETIDAADARWLYRESLTDFGE